MKTILFFAICVVGICGYFFIKKHPKLQNRMLDILYRLDGTYFRQKLLQKYYLKELYEELSQTDLQLDIYEYRLLSINNCLIRLEKKDDQTIATIFKSGTIIKSIKEKSMSKQAFLKEIFSCCLQKGSQKHWNEDIELIDKWINDNLSYPLYLIPYTTFQYNIQENALLYEFKKEDEAYCSSVFLISPEGVKKYTHKYKETFETTQKDYWQRHLNLVSFTKIAFQHVMENI